MGTTAPLRIAIAGLGNMGTQHVQTVSALKRFELAGICDADQGCLERAGTFTAAPRYREYGTMLDRETPDAVLIATPHYDHPGMAIRPSGAGCTSWWRNRSVCTAWTCDAPSQPTRKHGRGTPVWSSPPCSTCAPTDSGKKSSPSSMKASSAAWCAPRGSSRTGSAASGISTPAAGVRHGRDTLDDEFLDEVGRYRYRGSREGEPGAGRAPDSRACRARASTCGARSLQPQLDYMERAYDDAKAGRFSRRPYIDMVIPTLVDPSMAPPGKHVMSCFVQYAPYHLADGPGTTPAQARSARPSSTPSRSERPNIRQLILHARCSRPGHRGRSGLTEGNIFQGELSLEQLFFNRPCRAGPGTARRIRTSGCAARPRTRAAGSWARPAGSPPSRS